MFVDRHTFTFKYSATSPLTSQLVNLKTTWLRR